jgi:hypothetical protein
MVLIEYFACFRKRVSVVWSCDSWVLDEVRAPLYFRLSKWLRHALFCCVCNCCVLWHVCIMYSRDEKVFTILALFTYDYENICMNRWLEYIWWEMYVCCYVWFAYAREVCIHCISIYGEAYAHAFGSCVYGVVIGRAHLFIRSDRESYEIFVEIDTWWSGEPRGAVIGRAHSNPCSDRESYGILLILLVGDGPTISGAHASW